jgi:hypothetical protein
MPTVRAPLSQFSLQSHPKSRKFLRLRTIPIKNKMTHRDNLRVINLAFHGWIFMNHLRNLALFLVFIVACERPQHHAELDAYVSREDDHWLQDVIPVCFEQARGFERDRAIIQEAVSSEYARAGIHFTGWNVCAANDAGIRISFDENAGVSQTIKIGRENSGLAQNLVMGLKSRCAGVFSESVCESNIALHEFGHALGLHHEMNRRDNKTCGQDQTSGEGEDALQLGAYDSRSVMDYCFLYAANDRMEALRLSEQDVAALRVLKKGLIASLDRTVPMTLEETWTGFVKGPALTSYRYALGPKDELACDQITAYSASLPLDQAMTIDPRMMKTEPDKVWSLCLLGENAGERQDLNVYSAIDFRILNTMEISNVTALALTQNPLLYRQDQNLVLELSVGPGPPLRSLFASLAYADASIYRRINSTPFASRDLGSGRYQLFFPVDAFPANGEIYVSNLDLTDILGRKLSLFSMGSWSEFFGHPWLSPASYVNWSYDNDGRGPALLQMSPLPETLEAGGKMSLTMTIEENSRIQRIRLVMKSGAQTLEPNLQWQKLDDRNYRVELEIPRLAVNGEYRLDSLGLEDVMDNRSYYYLDTDSNLIADTQIPAPRFTVFQGLVQESIAPRLTALSFVTPQQNRKNRAFVDLDISDESSIKQVQLSLRHATDQGFYKTIYGIDLGEVAGKRRVELNLDARHPSGQFHVYEVTITDRFGNSIRYEMDPHNPGFLTGGLPAGNFELLP